MRGKFGPLIEESGILRLEIERAFRLFDCLALDGVGVNHRCPYIAVSQQFLNRTNIVIGLQQMAGKTVTKGMARGPLRNFGPLHGPLDGLLHMGVVKVIASGFSGFRNMGQGLCRKKPLPYQFLGGIFIFFL